MTPESFLDAIAEGTDPTAQDKATVDSQIKNHQIKVFVFNSQNSTPDVQALVKAAKAEGIPIVDGDRDARTGGLTFQAWQVKQLQALEGCARESDRIVSAALSPIAEMAACTSRTSPRPVVRGGVGADAAVSLADGPSGAMSPSTSSRVSSSRCSARTAAASRRCSRRCSVSSPSASGELRVAVQRLGTAMQTSAISRSVGASTARRGSVASTSCGWVSTATVGASRSPPASAAAADSPRSASTSSSSSSDAAPYAHRPIGSLSGGEQQRLLIAQALARRPSLLAARRAARQPRRRQPGCDRRAPRADLPQRRRHRHDRRARRQPDPSATSTGSSTSLEATPRPARRAKSSPARRSAASTAPRSKCSTPPTAVPSSSVTATRRPITPTSTQATNPTSTADTMSVIGTGLTWNLVRGSPPALRVPLHDQRVPRRDDRRGRRRGHRLVHGAAPPNLRRPHPVAGRVPRRRRRRADRRRRGVGILRVLPRGRARHRRDPPHPAGTRSARSPRSSAPSRRSRSPAGSCSSPSTTGSSKA